MCFKTFLTFAEWYHGQFQVDKVIEQNNNKYLDNYQLYPVTMGLFGKHSRVWKQYIKIPFLYNALFTSWKWRI